MYKIMFENEDINTFFSNMMPFIYLFVCLTSFCGKMQCCFKMANMNTLVLL